MRWIGMLLLLSAATFYGVKSWYGVHRFEGVSERSVETDYHLISAEIKQHDAQMTVPVGGDVRLTEMRRDRVALWVEWKRRVWKLDEVVPWLGVLGVLLLVVPAFASKWRESRKFPKKTRSRALDENVREAPSREEYVDEWDFHRRIEGAFHTREEAVEWLLHDPLLNCDYCGGRLRSAYEGGREALQMVTFYKNVPEGARDLRIVLGSYWFALTASEIKCASCGRMVTR